MKDSTSTLYSLAVAAVRTASETKQTELDAAAAVERQKNIDATREAATSGVPTDSPAYPVCALVAHTLTIGRSSDGFPDPRIPTETVSVVAAAIHAGVILETPGKIFYVGKLKVSSNGALESYGVNHGADYQAWDRAQEYRKHQTWNKL